MRSSSATDVSRSARVMPWSLNSVAYSDMSRFANSSSKDVSWYDTVFDSGAGTCEFNLHEAIFEAWLQIQHFRRPTFASSDLPHPATDLIVHRTIWVSPTNDPLQIWPHESFRSWPWKACIFGWSRIPQCSRLSGNTEDWCRTECQEGYHSQMNEASECSSV